MPEPPHPPTQPPVQPGPSQYVRIEAEALNQLAARLDTTLKPALEHALTLLAACTATGHHVILTGIGKSGIIATQNRRHAQLHGTPAAFLHPVEALHGDLGTVLPGDVLLALSYSGETHELLALLPAVQRLRLPIIAFTGCLTSTLAAAATIALDTAVSTEACHNNLAPPPPPPPCSRSATRSLSSSAAAPASTPRISPTSTPAAASAASSPASRTSCTPATPFPASPPPRPCPPSSTKCRQKKLGMTTVLSANETLAGIISDGDLRRLLERTGPQALERTAGEIMNSTPLTIAPTAFASEALAQMEHRKITALVVVQSRQVVGVLHLHDLWQLNP